MLILSDSANTDTILLDTLIFVQFYDVFFWIFIRNRECFSKPRDS